MKTKLFIKRTILLSLSLLMILPLLFSSLIGCAFIDPNNNNTGDALGNNPGESEEVSSEASMDELIAEIYDPVKKSIKLTEEEEQFLLDLACSITIDNVSGKTYEAFRDDLSICCIGKTDSVYVFFVDGGLTYFTRPNYKREYIFNSEKCLGEFIYRTNQNMYVYHHNNENGQFLTLELAHQCGYIKDDDVKLMAEIFDRARTKQPISNPADNYTPEPIDDETLEKVFASWCDYAKPTEQSPTFSRDSFESFYYGTFNDCIVYGHLAFFGGMYIGELEKQVIGKHILYSSGRTKFMVYRDNETMTLAEAFEKGYIYEHNLRIIAGYTLLQNKRWFGS